MHTKRPYETVSEVENVLSPFHRRWAKRKQVCSRPKCGGWAASEGQDLKKQPIIQSQGGRRDKRGREPGVGEPHKVLTAAFHAQESFL